MVQPWDYTGKLTGKLRDKEKELCEQEDKSRALEPGYAMRDEKLRKDVFKTEDEWQDTTPSLIDIPEALSSEDMVVEIPLVKQLFPRLVRREQKRAEESGFTAGETTVYKMVAFKRQAMLDLQNVLYKIYDSESAIGKVTGCPGSGKTMSVWYWFLRQVAEKEGYGCWLSLRPHVPTMVVRARKAEVGKLKLQWMYIGPDVKKALEGSFMKICDGVVRSTTSEFISFVGCPQIQVSSGGVKQSNDEFEVFFENYTSWTEEEHLQACKVQKFWSSVSSLFVDSDVNISKAKEAVPGKKTAMDVSGRKTADLTETANDIKEREEKVRMKSFYVEGSARWMYMYNLETAIIGVENKLGQAKTVDYMDVLTGKSKEHNHLRAIVKDEQGHIKNTVLSKYVHRRLFDIHGQRFLNEMRTILAPNLVSNKSRLGWILELQFVANVKAQLEMAQANPKGNRSTIRVQFEGLRPQTWNVAATIFLRRGRSINAKDAASIKNGALVVLEPFNFPAVDLFVLERVGNDDIQGFGINFGNITSGDCHDLKFEYVRNFVKHIIDELKIEIHWVNFAFILPHDHEGRFTVGDITGTFLERSMHEKKKQSNSANAQTTFGTRGTKREKVETTEKVLCTKDGNPWVLSNARKNIQILKYNFNNKHYIRATIP